MRGENCGGTEADVWAGSVTMMKALVGNEKITWSTEQVSCHAYNIILYYEKIMFKPGVHQPQASVHLIF